MAEEKSEAEKKIQSIERYIVYLEALGRYEKIKKVMNAQSSDKAAFLKRLLNDTDNTLKLDEAAVYLNSLK